MDDQTLLDLVNTQISALLSGGAVKSWGEGGHNVQHFSLAELMTLKRELETRITEATAPLCVPIISRDI